MNTLCISARAGNAKPSPTLTITAKANAMKAEGIDVVSFAAGEPDFPTPDPICQAAKKAIDDGFTKYTPTPGIPALREAISAKLKAENGVEAAPEQIVVSCGAKHSLFNSVMALVDPGDEVIVFSPYWMTYIDQIEFAGGKAIAVETFAEDGYIPTKERIEEKLSPRTKAILLNTPCNPTGAVFPRQTLKDIAAVALRHNLWLICDEIYEKLVYGAEHVSMASLGRDVAERTITVGGCSKSFAMTGWRIGFAAAPKEVAKAMACMQDSVTSNPNSFAQKGAIAAYAMSPAEIEKMRAEFETRRDLMHAELSKIQGLGVPLPMGAFYFLIDVSNFLGAEAHDDADLAGLLLERARVATVPGSVFAAPGCLRVTYTSSQSNISKGIARLAETLSQLRA